MTRKYYIKVAQACGRTRRLSGTLFRAGDGKIFVRAVDLEEALAEIFAEDNPNFNRTKFLSRCQEGGR